MPVGRNRGAPCFDLRVSMTRGDQG